jgi:hypothetical protein
VEDFSPECHGWPAQSLDAGVVFGPLELDSLRSSTKSRTRSFPDTVARREGHGGHVGARRRARGRSGFRRRRGRRGSGRELGCGGGFCATPWHKREGGGGLEGPGRRRGVVAVLCLSSEVLGGAGRKTTRVWGGLGRGQGRWASPVGVR